MQQYGGVREIGFVERMLTAQRSDCKQQRHATELIYLLDCSCGVRVVQQYGVMREIGFVQSRPTGHCRASN